LHDGVKDAVRGLHFNLVSLKSRLSVPFRVKTLDFQSDFHQQLPSKLPTF
jgi:hypothetical protein